MNSIEQWRSLGRLIPLDGHQIFSLDTLSPDFNKPVLLLIHGFPTCSWDWAKIWSSLAERFQLVTLDLLGFGFSDKPLQDYSIMQQANIIDLLMTELNVSEYHILAHDYGDTVAQELLARHNSDHSIKSIIFCNGGLFPETHKPVMIQKLLLSPIGSLISKFTTFKAFSATFSRICAQPISEDELKTYWRMLNHNHGTQVMHKLIAYMLERRKFRARWVGALKTDQVKLHLINGVLDPISGEHMVKRYCELVPNSSVDRLLSTGHYPQVESPIEFLRCADFFWDKIAVKV